MRRNVAKYYTARPICYAAFDDTEVDMSNSVFIFLLQIHKSVEDLHKVVNKDILPKEYGGIVPMADMIGKW